MKPESELSPPLVMVIGDDPAVCSSLKFLLEVEGFAVRTYGSAGELLNSSEASYCSCFVIDQKMPGMSGMELITKLRDRKVLTPAILIIGQPIAALGERAAKAAIPVVEKPLTGNELLDRIREACRRG